MNVAYKIIAVLCAFVAGIAFDALYLRSGPHEDQATIIEDTSSRDITIDGILVRRDATLGDDKALYVTRHRVPFFDNEGAPAEELIPVWLRIESLPGVTDASREDDYTYIITKPVSYKWAEVDPEVVRALNKYRPKQ